MENKLFADTDERDYSSAILAIIRSECTDSELGKQLEKYHANDIAAVISSLTSDERERLLSVLGNEAMSEIVSYLDDASDYLSELDVEDAADIIEQMDASEALDALDTLDKETRDAVLDRIDDMEVREEIGLIDSYDDDQFGSRMSTNFISIRKDFSIKAATKTLISEAAQNDNIYTLFVTDENGRFYGAIDLKDLIVARSGDKLESLICTTFPYVFDNDIISDNIERLRGYSEDLIPVLSQEDGRILGVITTLEIVEIVDEEMGDDYAKLAALVSEEEGDETLWQSMKKRVPWLIALLFMGLAVSVVVSMFENVVEALPMIVSFQSLILGMAGNVGTQSLAVTVRLLGSDEASGFKRQLVMIVRETRVALLNGAALGVISFIIVSGYLLLFTAHGLTFALSVAICVGLAMCFAMTVSGLTGALIPISLYRFGIDPAVASGPLITTVNDLVAVITYYGLAWGLIINLI